MVETLHTTEDACGLAAHNDESDLTTDLAFGAGPYQRLGRRALS
jgi:hypothetical protein